MTYNKRESSFVSNGISGWKWPSVREREREFGSQLNASCVLCEQCSGELGTPFVLAFNDWVIRNEFSESDMIA